MWVQATYITDDTDIIASQAASRLMAFVSDAVARARHFDGLDLRAQLRRKFDLLKLELSLPAPSDKAQREELATIATRMGATYGKGKYCTDRKDLKSCRDLGQLSKTMATSRDYEVLLDAWQGWRTISPPIRADYQRFVELGNAGAREMGFADLGALWNSRYDMPHQEFEAEIERLWQQVKPLYQQLHCYVRARLAKAYGQKRVPAGQPIPAHLLGNMWAQEWGNIFDLVAPQKGGAFDLTRVLVKNKLSERDMVKRAEAFFVSQGLQPLPKSFWKRSMFTKPADREVVCHASAWDIDWQDDLRIKMCIEKTADDFITIHHELGHNYYQRAYKDQPMLFTNGANDGFHEALGDTLALSVTPAYLKQIGLIKKLPPDNLNPLMRRALDKIAFLPFGLVVDKWRFDVFAGRVGSDQYNAHWWELRRRYQGIAAPVDRTEANFDPGAKYHIPANTPYTRYFLAAVLQFQFFRALCKDAGHQGPLHQCSLYGSSQVGDKLQAMMQMGNSQPWPQALKVLTGDEKMDATAIIDYFEPLMQWLAKKNEKASCGW